MKNCHKPLLLCLFALISYFAHAATGLFPGYYISKNGDSVHCSIEYNDWYKNPKTIVVEANNVKSTFKVADINGFGVTGYGDYKSATVSYHTNPVTGPNIPAEFSDQIETDDCFLRVVTAGVYSLYELILPEKHYYFIQEKDGAISELIYRVKIDPANLTAIPDLRYKNVFSDLFAKENIGSEDQYLITTATYNKTSLERLIDRLNETKTGMKVTRSGSTDRPKSKLIKIDVFAGGILNTFPTAFPGVYAPAAKMPSSFSPTGGLDFRCSIPGTHERLSFGAALQYSEYKTSTTINSTSNDSLSATWVYSTQYSEHLSTSGSLFMTNFYVMYLFMGNAKWNVYGKLGFTYDALFAKNKYIYSEYSRSTVLYANGLPPQPQDGGQSARAVLNFADETVSANLSIGVLSGVHRIELAYYTPKQLADDNQNPFRLAQYGLYYYFTILK